MALEHTLQEADSLLKTFNALLSLSRIEAGKGHGEMKKLNIARVLEDSLELYEPLIEEEEGRLSAHITKDIFIKADRQLISQAFSNLFDNILKYAPGTKVTVRLERVEPRHVRIIISDQGPGIPKDKRGDVLKRFSRLDKSRSRPGSGLGLSLVKSVIDLHDGRLSLQDAEKSASAPGLRLEIDLPIIT